MKKNFKGGGSEDGANIKTQQALIEKTPYRVSPSFIEHNGKFMALLNMYVKPGSNRHMTFQDVIDFIPISTLEGVEIHLISKDMLIKGQEKQRIIKKNSNTNKSALVESTNVEKEKNTVDNSTVLMRQAQIADYNEYELILDSPEPLIVFKWILVVIGNTRESIDEQIETINTLLDQNHEGARWDSLPAEQIDEFKNMFTAIMPNVYDHTSTGSNYSGLSFALNAGLVDRHGVPIGADSLSISGSSAFFDFDKSTKKQAFIAAPRNSKIAMYSHQDEFSSPSMTSMAAQAAANQIMMAGHRAHHIVLNDFDYFEKGRYFAVTETDQIFRQYDVKDVSLNPLQGFGHIDQVVQVYDRLINKIVNIFDILLDFKMELGQRSAILAAVDRFYYNQQLWTANADKAPHKTRIVNITKPETYPTMGQLLNEFTSLAVQAQQQNRELKADNLDNLQMLLRQTLNTYMSVLGRTTTIEETDAPQVYYQFNNIESMAMKQVQLLNLLDYIIYTAKEGDVIIIHGFDNILSRVAIMTQSSIQAAQKNGIRFIFAFDTIRSAESKSGKMNDMFDLQQQFYTDLDTDVDWSMVGRLLPIEVDYYARAMNQELGPTVEALMQMKLPNQVLVHRHHDGINNFVRLSPVI